jgi:hypothetical protein
MEIAPSAVQDEARQQVEEEALEALVGQYASTLYRVAFSILRNPTLKTPCRRRFCGSCGIATLWAKFATIASG